MRMSLVLVLILFGGAGHTVQAAIPVDHFDDLTLDAPVENRVRAGDPLRFAGQVGDPSLTAVQIAFESDTGQRHDFFFLVRPDGRFERDLVFLEDQTGSYHVHAFAGPLGEAMPFKGTYSQVVVDGVSDTMQWPVGFFDGARLDAPLPMNWPVGRSLRVQGEILDPRIRQMRLDLQTAAGPRSVSLPHAAGRFDAFVDFSLDESGLVEFEWVTGLVDGSYWGRGRALLAVDGEPPLGQLQVQALALSIPPGGEAAIPLANAGNGELSLQPPTVDAPFRVVASPRGLAPGARGEIRVRHDGKAAATGTVRIHSDDPRRPVVDVAVTGLAAATQIPGPWRRARGDVPVEAGEQIVALYSASRSDVEGSVPFTLGQAPIAWQPQTAHRAAPSARDQAEALLRQREAMLAVRVAARGPIPAARPLVSLAEVGDHREFRFDAFAGVPAQQIPAIAAIVSRRAVAWVHEGRDDLPGTDQIAAMLHQFDEDYDLLVTQLGSPSDVDGDGRIHFLYTPLVDATGFGGFVDAASILAPEVGGNGNHTDLIFIAVDEPADSYRSLLAHEFQHLISFNEHVLVRYGDSEVSWLNEGLSHVAEDLVGGYARGGNPERVAAYLADPSLVGLVGDAATSDAKRGGAYLFVRSLVDRFGPQILVGLIGSGLADVDNLERATGEAFQDLLAGFAAQLITSGTPLATHPRFDYQFEPLAPEGRRGFGVPHLTRLDAAGGLRGQLPRRGLSYFRVVSDKPQQMSLQAPDGSGIRALVLPLPNGFEFPVHIPRDFFSRLTLDESLSAVVHSGEALHITGRIDPDIFPPGHRQPELVLEYQLPDEDGGGYPTFDLAVEEDHFDGDIVFAHAQAGDYKLALFARWSLDDTSQYEWLGSFQPARVLAGSGIVHLPRRFFDRLVLDHPWPLRMAPGSSTTLSGQVHAREDAPELVRLQVDLAGPTDTLSVQMEIVDGHFTGRLALTNEEEGRYTLNVFGQDEGGDFIWLGGSDFFEIGHVPVTAVLESGAVRPATAALGHNYPNPFNSHTLIPFRLAASSGVVLSIYNLAGQRVTAWDAGVLSMGDHQWHWNGQSDGGDALASGVYIVQLQAGAQRLRSKLLLLR